MEFFKFRKFKNILENVLLMSDSSNTIDSPFNSIIEEDFTVNNTENISAKSEVTYCIYAYLYENAFEGFNWEYELFPKERESSIEKIKQYIIEDRYETALDTIFEEINILSNYLSNRFNFTLENRAYIPDLIQYLYDAEIILEEEWQRLMVLNMMLDGLDIKVHEGNGKIGKEAIDIIIEYKNIIKNILRRKNEEITINEDTINSNLIETLTTTVKNWNIEICPNYESNTQYSKKSIVGLVD